MDGSFFQAKSCLLVACRSRGNRWNSKWYTRDPLQGNHWNLRRI